MNLLHCRIQNASAESVRDRVVTESAYILQSFSDLDDLDFRVTILKISLNCQDLWSYRRFVPRVGIAGEVGWFNPPPQFMFTDTHF